MDVLFKIKLTHTKHANNDADIQQFKHTCPHNKKNTYTDTCTPKYIHKYSYKIQVQKTHTQTNNTYKKHPHKMYTKNTHIHTFKHAHTIKQKKHQIHTTLTRDNPQITKRRKIRGNTQHNKHKPTYNNICTNTNHTKQIGAANTHKHTQSQQYTEQNPK